MDVLITFMAGYTLVCLIAFFSLAGIANLFILAGVMREVWRGRADFPRARAVRPKGERPW